MYHDAPAAAGWPDPALLSEQPPQHRQNDFEHPLHA